MVWKTSLNSQIKTRSSHPEVFLSEGVLKNFAKFTEKHLCRSLLFNKVTGWKPETVRGNHWGSSVNNIGVFKKAHWCFRTSRSALYEIGVIGLSTNFTGKNLCWSLFLIKLHFCRPEALLKKTSTQVLPCEICKLLVFTNFQNNYFDENLWVSASKLYLFLWIIQEQLFCRGSTNGWFWNTIAGVFL